MAKVTTSFNKWDFDSKHVQQNLTGGEFVGSHTTLICATAPRQDMLVDGLAGSSTGVANPFESFSYELSPDSVYGVVAIPLGVLQNASVMQNRQIQAIYEIGSKRRYTVSSRTDNTISLGRTLFSGPSLLRMLYAYYPESKLGGSNVLRDNPACPDTAMSKIRIKEDPCHVLPTINKQDLPGYDNFFVNLASSLFQQPLGIVIYFKNNNTGDVGAMFLEECSIVTHQMGISSGAVVLAEGVQLTCDRIIPLKANVSRTAQDAFNTFTNTLNPNSSINVRESLENLGGAVRNVVQSVGL